MEFHLQDGKIELKKELNATKILCLVRILLAKNLHNVIYNVCVLVLATEQILQAKCGSVRRSSSLQIANVLFGLRPSAFR